MMAFSCAYMLKRIRETDVESDTVPQIINLDSLTSTCDKNAELDVPYVVKDILYTVISSVSDLNSNSLHANIDKVEQETSDYTVFKFRNTDNTPNEISTNDEILESSEKKTIVSVDDFQAENSASDYYTSIEKVDCDNEMKGTIESSEDFFDFKHTPIQLTGAWSDFLNSTKNNYTRGCKWAPDGSCILTCSDDNLLRIFNLPIELWDSSKWSDISEMESVLKISEGELIYDFCWYPMMNSAEPGTCCLASCSKSSTVHLWDAFTGSLRCSYRAYDQMDEITASRSLSFDADGSRIFCGFEKAIRVFNIDLPGRNCEVRRIFDKKSGQSGIISCFAFTTANRNISAAGSYQRTIGIYSEPDGTLECVLEGQKGGLTHLQFSPDGNLLYSGGRKDSDILCWDMRNLGEVLYCMRRSCLTNQRMYFDISRNGQYVVSGNTNGVITVWDTLKEAKTVSQDDFNVLEPVQFFIAHNDCVNGIGLHPTFPLLCSSSGQRKFPQLLSDDEDDVFSLKTVKSDNSLRLWWVGHCS